MIVNDRFNPCLETHLEPVHIAHIISWYKLVLYSLAGQHIITEAMPGSERPNFVDENPTTLERLISDCKLMNLTHEVLFANVTEELYVDVPGCVASTAATNYSIKMSWAVTMIFPGTKS